MGYLNNESITVDAILTRRGRELLSRGRNEFQITHFALADDEIDYGLWNSDHPLGSAYYGVVIENLPITEAVPDETQCMKYKLVTLPKKTIRIPIVSVPQTSITLTAGQASSIRPQTINYSDGNSTYGYTAVLADSDVCILEVVEAAKGMIGDPSTIPAPISDSESGQSVTVSGREFRVRAKGAILASKATTLTIYGNETGGSVVVNITVQKQTLNTTPNMPLTGNPPISLP